MCKAIITTDTAGCSELVEENVNGFLCDKKSAESLAEKIIWSFLERLER